MAFVGKRNKKGIKSVFFAAIRNLVCSRREALAWSYAIHSYDAYRHPGKPGRKGS